MNPWTTHAPLERDVAVAELWLELGGTDKLAGRRLPDSLLKARAISPQRQLAALQSQLASAGGKKKEAIEKLIEGVQARLKPAAPPVAAAAPSVKLAPKVTPQPAPKAAPKPVPKAAPKSPSQDGGGRPERPEKPAPAGGVGTGTAATLGVLGGVGLYGAHARMQETPKAAAAGASKALAMLAGAAVFGTAGGVMQYNAAKPQPGGKSRDELHTELRIHERKATQANEGVRSEGPLHRFTDTLNQYALDEARKWKQNPGTAAGMAAVPWAAAGAYAGHQTYSRLARYL